MLSKQIEKVLWFSLVIVLLFNVGEHKANILQSYYTNSVYMSSSSPKQVVLGGNAIGFEYQSDGVLVLSNSGVANFDPKNLSLQSGDIIIDINGQKIESSSHISQILNSKDLGREVVIGFLRNGKSFDVTVIPVFDIFAKEYKLGVWVKDFISGVGTLTFVDEKTGRFGALGHSMCESSTGKALQVKKGILYDCNIVGVAKGVRGVPGELRGVISKRGEIGSVDKNCDSGVYGRIDNLNILKNNKIIDVGGRNAVKPGKAQIFSSVDGDGIKGYDIQIIKTNYQSYSNEKSLVFRVVDKDLIAKTGGIVQGMSGSPIVQNGKLVGAVTHVFSNDQTKGFGIYIDWML